MVILSHQATANLREHTKIIILNHQNTDAHRLELPTTECSKLDQNYFLLSEDHPTEQEQYLQDMVTV